MDKGIYSLIFPSATVIPKGSCHEVERAVESLQAGEGFHWLTVFGIVDGDGYTSQQIQEKRDKGVYTLPLFSVEAVYFHEQIIQLVASHQAASRGEDVSEMYRNALNVGVEAISAETERLSKKAAMKSARKMLIEQIPNDSNFFVWENITIQNSAIPVSNQLKDELDVAVSDGDWETILKKCSVRESRAFAMISQALRFPTVEDYQQTVRQQLRTNETALQFTRELFGDLYEHLKE